MSEIKKYVRILKAGKPSYWYINKIGRMFEFEREGDFTYKTREKDGSLAVIRKEDAELIVTEKRPAKVGEKVLILDDFNEPNYMLHDVVPVIGGGDEHGVAVRKLGEWPIYLNNEQYEVIVNNEEDDEVENGEQRYDIAVETARDAIEELRLAAYAKGYEDARHELMAQAPVEKTAQERRDEIVERAKADVERLSNRYQIKNYYKTSVNFVVNHEKRTVVALLIEVNTGMVRTKGIAKAAPDDCFNVHIGKAIALHRALGREVPDEYLNVPHPTEVRVGDVVRSIVDRSKEYVISEDEKARCGSGAGLTSLVAKYGKIIDDSRTEAI